MELVSHRAVGRLNRREGAMGRTQTEIQPLVDLRVPAYLLALRLARSPEIAEDAVQEAYIKALAALRRGERPDDARTWFLRIAANAAKDLVRGEARRREREATVAREEQGRGPARPDAGLREALAAAMWEVAEDERVALSLHYESGLTQAEAAAVLGLPEGTVRTRVSRGLERLREVLGRMGVTAAPAAILGTFAGGPLEAVPASLAAAVGKLLAGGLPAVAQAAKAGAVTKGTGAAATAVKGGIAMKVIVGVVAAGVLAGAVAIVNGLGTNVGVGLRPAPTALSAPPTAAPAAAEAKPAPVNDYKGMQEREEVFEFTEKPRAAKEGDKTVITFASKGKCDVTVSIVAPDGKIVRHLASGVLGANAPWPFQQNSLAQKIEWDGQTDNFKPAPAGCKVRVSLGLQAKYERDIAWDPQKGTYIEKDGKYFRTLFPPPADAPEDKLKEGGLRPATTIWGDRTFIGNRFGSFREPTGNEKEPPTAKCLAALTPVFADKAPPRKVEIPAEKLPADKDGGWYDRNPRLAVDPATEDLYARGPGNNTIFRFDGKTGKLDPTWFPKGEFDQVSEIDVGPDGLLYVRSSLHAYGRWLFRVDRTGKPVDFPKGEVIPPGDRQVPRVLAKQQIKGMYTGVNGHSNIHQKGFDVAVSGRIVTIIGEVDAKWAVAQGIAKEAKGPEVPGYYVEVWDNDGQVLSANAVAGSEIGHGVRMDREGNIYLVQSYLLPAGQKGLDGIPDDMSVKLSNEWGLWGGPSSLIKFRGLGDKFPVGRRYSGKELSQAPADAIKLHDYRRNTPSDAVSGALWAYGGVTVQARSCSCNHGRGDLDGFARSWVLANQVCSVMVLDANGNRIARIGRYGNVDDEGIRFAWVRAVAASDSALYAMDFDNRRILKAALSYAAEETVPVP